MRKILVLFCLFAPFFWVATSFAKPKLSSSNVRSVERTDGKKVGNWICAYQKGKWKVKEGKLKKNGKVSLTSKKSDKSYSKRLAAIKAKGLAKKKEKKALNKLKEQRRKAKEFCADKNEEGTQPISDGEVELSSLPKMQDMAATDQSSQSNAQSFVELLAGEPTLSNVNNDGASAYFWESGLLAAIIDGSASPEQCNEFWGIVESRNGDDVNGENEEDVVSGGLSACFSAEGVGHAFNSLANPSLCYTQNAFTQEIFDAGGFTVTSGKLDKDSFDKLYEPGDQDRLIKVAVVGGEGGEHGDTEGGVGGSAGGPGGGGPGDEGPGEGGPGEGGPGEGPVEQDIYIKVLKSQKGLLYSVKLYFCQEDGLVGVEDYSIDDSGKFSGSSKNQFSFGEQSENVVSTLSAYLAKNSEGDLVFDTSQSRSAEIRVQSGSFRFAADVQVNADNTLDVKTYDIFSGGGGSSSHKSASVSEFSGTSFESLAYVQGAFVDQRGFGDFSEENQGAARWGGSYYVADPENKLLTRLDEVDFSKGFFASEPSADVDLGGEGFDCANPGETLLEIEMDMSKDALRQVAEQCEPKHDGFRFCQDDDTVREAEEKWFENCAMGPGEGGPGEGGPGEGDGPPGGGPGEGDGPPPGGGPGGGNGGDGPPGGGDS